MYSHLKDRPVLSPFTARKGYWQTSGSNVTQTHIVLLYMSSSILVCNISEWIFTLCRASVTQRIGAFASQLIFWHVTLEAMWYIYIILPVLVAQVVVYMYLIKLLNVFLGKLYAIWCAQNNLKKCTWMYLKYLERFLWIVIIKQIDSWNS